MPILPSPGPRWLSLAMDLVRSVLSLDLTGYVRSANCLVVENVAFSLQWTWFWKIFVAFLTAFGRKVRIGH